jgi:hypothetical protein
VAGRVCSRGWVVWVVFIGPSFLRHACRRVSAFADVLVEQCSVVAGRVVHGPPSTTMTVFWNGEGEISAEYGLQDQHQFVGGFAYGTSTQT